MLREPMNRVLSIAFLVGVLTPGACSAQTTLDVPVQLTGAPAQRTVTGLGEPTEETAAVTVQASVLESGFTWCSATLVGDTFMLAAEPAVTALQDGLLMRFAAPVDRDGRLFVKAMAQAPAKALVRADGLPPTRGQIRTGVICELLYAHDAFVLLNASEIGCPQGFVPANERLCMEVAVVPNMLFHDAKARCADLGGKLCTWDEFVVGCNLLSGQLQNQFQNWEWMDDTSNHSHGADLFGQLTCQSMRNVGALTTFTANSRCCYHPR